MTDVSPLRQAIEGHGATLKDLTVLDKANDPFRVDTPARHRDGEWLATTARELGLADRRIHLRGLHYMVIGRPKPDGTPYANTEADWLWLSGDAGKAARWLGYIPFDQIVDQRNDAPTVRTFKEPRPHPYIRADVEVDVPSADDLEPFIGAYWVDHDGKTHSGFGELQPYKLVLVGEKSSLEPVLSGIAETYRADLYLPTGEMSDTLIHRIATVGKADGRPMIVFYFADCDPSGWQMGISVARKLQAFEALGIGPTEWELSRVALTPDQVREHGLPSTPLKSTEKRAELWQQRLGVEQTEIDALAALRPELLDQIARKAIDPYFDHTLNRRSWQAYTAWQAEAQTALDAAMDTEHLARIRSEAAERLTELREQIDAINDAMRIDPGDIELPPIHAPEAELNGGSGMPPLLDSRWEFPEQCRRLKDSKAYQQTGGAA